MQIACSDLPAADQVRVGEFFEVRRSKQLDREAFPDAVHSGLGLFARVRCRLTIVFQSMCTVRILRGQLSDRQLEYRVDCGDDEDYVFTPTLRSLTPPHIVTYFWRIQHNSKAPTHALDWDPAPHHMRLVPLRVLEAGDEVTFNYLWTSFPRARRRKTNTKRNDK